MFTVIMDESCTYLEIQNGTSQVRINKPAFQSVELFNQDCIISLPCPHIGCRGAVFPIGTPGIEVYHAVLEITLIPEAVLRISYLAAVFSIGLALLSPLHAIGADKAGPHAANAPSAGLPSNEGKVLSTLDAPGYTYMELANTEKRFWIAAPTTRVKVGDRVRFEQSLVMKNFNSKTLNRTFDQIIFVNSATVVN